MKTPHKIYLATFLILVAGVAVQSRLSSSQLSKLARYPFKIETLTEIDEAPFYEAKKKKQKISARELVLLAELTFEKAKREANAGVLAMAEDNARQSLLKSGEFNVPAKLLIAKIHEYKHEFNEALQIAREILNSNPQHLSAVKIALTSQLALGNYSEAEVLAERLTLFAPQTGNYVLRGLVAAALNKDPEAEQYFVEGLEKELGITPRDSAWSRSMIARFCLERGRFSEAEVLLTEALRIAPHSPLAFALRGELLLRRKNYDQSAASFLQAFEVSKQSLFLIGFARAKSAAGQSKMAQQAFMQAESLLRADLENSQGHRMELATLLLERGNPSDGPEALRLALAELQLRKTPQNYFVVARAQAALANWPAAQEALLRSRSLAQTTDGYSTLAQTVASRLK